MNGNMRKLLIVLVAAACLSSCCTVRVTAPAGASVILASKTDYLPVKKSHAHWYCLWGIWDCDKNLTDRSIMNNDLKTVRVKNTMTFSDVAVSAVTMWFFGWIKTTTTVEGAK